MKQIMMMGMVRVGVAQPHWIRRNKMATCRECGAEHIVQYHCELCGNYGCIECGDHCLGCTNHMEEVED